MWTDRPGGKRVSGAGPAGPADVVRSFENNVVSGTFGVESRVVGPQITM